MDSVDLNYVAIVVAALVNMVLGGIWYSPPVFARPWMNAVGRTMDDLGGAKLWYLVAALSAAVMSVVLAVFVDWAGAGNVAEGALVGLLAWLGFVATVLALNTYFGGRPRVLWLIDAGYQLAALVLMGAILGAWQ